ncbi:MAG: S41 family peptidase, partial [Rhodothermaceae bacterium]
MKKAFLFFLFTVLTCTGLFAGNSPYVRFPAINADGSQIAFSYQGDIWTVSTTGGRAYRVTVHEAYETNPVWNKSGDKIAFESNRFGNNDIFTINAMGGTPFRITYMSTGDALSDWTNNNEIIFSSSRSYRQVEWDREMLKVSAKGSTPVRFMDAFGTEAVISPDGRFVAYTKGECRVAREAYTGSANKNIWIYDTKKDVYNQITTFEGQDHQPVWGNDNNLYFISARAGRYNIFSVKVDGNGKAAGTPKAVTNIKDDAVRNFDLSNDGKTIVFEKDTNIYTVAANGGSYKKVNIEIATDYKFDPKEHKTFRTGITEYAVSPNGKLSAFVIRGEVFVSENNKKKSFTVNLSKSPYRDQNVTWLSDSTLIFSSDREGTFDLYMAQSADKKNSNILKSLKHKITKLTDSEKDVHYPTVSPDGKKISYVIGEGKLVVANIDAEGDFSNKKVLLDQWSGPSGIRWSPDSKWLAYTLEDLNFNSEVFIHSADNSKKPVNVSMHPRGDYAPVWSPDGSKLGFLSQRHNSDADVWFVFLNKKDWEKTKKDWQDDDAPAKKSKKGKKGKVKPVKIDFENIHERVIRVTSFDGNEGGLAISKDGKTFYFTTKVPGAKGRDLYKIKWDGTGAKALTKGGVNPYGFILDKSGNNLYMVKRRALARVNTKSGKTESLPFSAKMIIDYKAELDQIFEEAWRTLYDQFYDPNFHGQDMVGLKKLYKGRALKASTKQDFVFTFNQMLGQINASHMGLYGGGRESTQRETTGRLGIEVKPLNKGVKVTRIVAETPADRMASKLKVGDVILAVNNEEVTKNMNFWSLLTNTVDSKVLLTVETKNGKEKDVVIRPARRINSALYNEMIKDKRALVDKYSNGKLGYLHIQGMSMPSFERFERELASAGYGKEGIVIDVRYNGGGWTTDYLMAILNVKQHAYTIPRGAAKSLEDHKKFKSYYPFGERLPFYAWNKPSVALCNQASYSNAEIFSHAYKSFEIGTLVGKPTFGAVISTGGKGLIDGT